MGDILAEVRRELQVQPRDQAAGVALAGGAQPDVLLPPGKGEVARLGHGEQHGAGGLILAVVAEDGVAFQLGEMQQAAHLRHDHAHQVGQDVLGVLQLHPGQVRRVSGDVADGQAPSFDGRHARLASRRRAVGLLSTNRGTAPAHEACRMEFMDAPVVAVTIGDPAGIGPEIVVRALADDPVRRAVQAVVVGDRWVVERAMEVTGTKLEFSPAGPLRLLDLANVDHRLQWGKIQATAGAAAGQFIERAVQEALAGRADALATAPINKEALWRAGYRDLGHTEMLGALTGSADPLTMFTVRNKRIFFLTPHMSLRGALGEVKRERLGAILPRIVGELQKLGFDRPHIAVAALNPHAGEGGALGKEDLDEIAPAVQDARGQGWQVDGPVPADAVFAQALDGRYDAVLALYHDQGHIAAKTLDFHGVVSVTLALPFIRTSVDHGTAFDIAGKGLARAESMAAAILMAGDLARRTKVGQRAGNA